MGESLHSYIRDLISSPPLELLISSFPCFLFLGFTCTFSWVLYQCSPWERVHASNVFETLYLLKHLYSISPLTGGLARYRILKWTSVYLEVMKSLLYCLLAFNGTIGKNIWRHYFCQALERIILFPFRNLLGPLYVYNLEISVWFDFLVHLACCIRIFVYWVVYNSRNITLTVLEVKSTVPALADSVSGESPLAES